MQIPLSFDIKLLTTMVALVLITSWKVDALNVHQRSTPEFADLPAQVALELSNVFSLGEFARVSAQVIFNSSLSGGVTFTLYLWDSRGWK